MAEQSVTYITKDGDVIDSIAHRVYGAVFGAVEHIYSNNPILMDLPAVLEAGISLKLSPYVSSTQDQQQTSFWEAIK